MENECGPVIYWYCKKCGFVFWIKTHISKKVYEAKLVRYRQKGSCQSQIFDFTIQKYYYSVIIKFIKSPGPRAGAGKVSKSTNLTRFSVSSCRLPHPPWLVLAMAKLSMRCIFMDLLHKSCLIYQLCIYLHTMSPENFEVLIMLHVQFN